MNYESDETDSEDDVPSRRQFVPVELPDDFDPTKPPADGMEYLQLAMYEARNRKSAAKSSKDFRKFWDKQTYRVEDEMLEGCKRLPAEKLPSESWQNKTLEEFAKYREYVQHYLPKSGQSSQGWIDKVDTECPNFKTVSCLNELELLRLLEVVESKLKFVKSGMMISDLLGAWLFAALSVISITSGTNTYTFLRSIARECSVIRHNIYKQNSGLDFTPLNVYICIISRYFKQFDLADQL